MTLRRLHSLVPAMLALTLVAGAFTVPAGAQIITETGPRKPRVPKVKKPKVPKTAPVKQAKPTKSATTAKLDSARTAAADSARAAMPAAAPVAKAPRHARLAGPLPRTLSELGEQKSDPRIATDLDAMDAWEAKIDSLPGSAADVWRAAAARAWLDAARVEYTDNDRQGFPQAAFVRGVALVSEIEAGKAPVDSSNAPGAVIPRGSVKVADSLYVKLAGLKQNPGFRCAREPIAQMEVELAWAGNEQVDQGDCRTSPHLARAAELARTAQELCEKCLPPPVAKLEEPPVPLPADTMRVIPAPVPTQEEMRIPRNVHFALNEFVISPTSRSVIAGITALLQKYPTVTARLVGHTDTRGSAEYNLRLSKRRVDAARAVFLEMGIDSSRLSTDYRGKSETYAIEDSKRGFALNRRVEMVFVDEKGNDIHGERQEGDLQLERDRLRRTARPNVTTPAKPPVRRRTAAPGARRPGH